MTDLTNTIIAKSDQLNADDLIGRSITIEITSVKAGAAEQPIAISYKGDNGKPYFPCKSMRRVLVHNWGPDGQKYVGRFLTLYRDPKVKFGGIEVGGIRISHMSDIAQEVTMALTASKANKKPFTVLPLGTTAKKKYTAEEKRQAAQEKAAKILSEINAASSPAEVEIIMGANKDLLLRLESAYSDLFKPISAAIAAKTAPVEPASTDEEIPL